MKMVVGSQERCHRCSCGAADRCPTCRCRDLFNSGEDYTCLSCGGVTRIAISNVDEAGAVRYISFVGAICPIGRA